MAAAGPTLKQHLAHQATDGGYASVWINAKVAVDDYQGTVMLDICSVCHYVLATCDCSDNTWRDAAGNKVTLDQGKANPALGVALICNLCGLDVT